MTAELDNCLQNINHLADILQRSYLPDKLGAAINQAAELPALPDDFLKEAVFYRVNAVRFRERKDIRYAVSSLLSALYQLGVPVFFIVRGSQSGFDLYLGIAGAAGEERERNNDEVKSALRGFLPGTEPEPCSEADRTDLANNLNNLSNIAALVGVPSEKTLFSEDKRNSPMEYGLERFVDAMTPRDYALVICATPVSQLGASSYYKQVSSCLDNVHPLTKVTDQHSIGKNWTDTVQQGTNKTKSDTETESGGENISTSYQDKNNILFRFFKESWRWVIGGKTAYPQLNESKSSGWQRSTSTSFGTSFSESHSHGGSSSDAQTVEHINSMATYAEDLLKLLQERLKNAMGEGLWKSTVLVLAADRQTAGKGAHMLAGMWSGGKSHQDPVRYMMLTDHEKMKGVSKPFLTALPLAALDFMYDHPLGDAYHSASTWLSSAELAHEFNLPHYALPDLAVEKVVEYGRFMPRPKEQSMLKLGEMIDYNVKTDVPVWLDLKKLNRHLFVTGLTGSGKSNTIRAILLELARQGIPFMVIEPAKKEYRSLKKRIRQMHERGETVFEDMDVYSLSDTGALWESIALNPFDFDVPRISNAGTALVAHIDRLKSVFNSALGMYSSMPFILEDIIYKAYANMGWDIETGKNKYLSQALEYYAADNREAMEQKLRPLFLPVLSDLKPLVQPALKSFFDGKSDYSISLSGALRSRLDSLTRGNKGAMLDSRISNPLGYRDGGMLNRPCVIELESFADNEEKAFIMALLLSRIYEYRIACHDGAISDKLKHVLVIEEAHRLLSQPQKGGEHTTDGKGKSVEVFSDMLAEIRAYGQGIIIADQIPAKLVPDVMKNTDVKIVHRLTAKDDREAVGAAMNLTKEQVEDLSKSVPGMATISYGGMNQAARVMMTEVKADSDSVKTNTPSYDMEKYRRDIFMWYDKWESPSGRISFKHFNTASEDLALLLAGYAIQEGKTYANCWLHFSTLMNTPEWDDHSDFLLRAVTEDIHRWMSRLNADAQEQYALQAKNLENADQTERLSLQLASLNAQISVAACAAARAAVALAEAVGKDMPDDSDFNNLCSSLAPLGHLLLQPRGDGVQDHLTGTAESLYGSMLRLRRATIAPAGGVFLANVLLGMGSIPEKASQLKPWGAATIADLLLMHGTLLQTHPDQADDVFNNLLKVKTSWGGAGCLKKLSDLRETLKGNEYRAVEACGRAAAHIRAGIGDYSTADEWERGLADYLAKEVPYSIRLDAALPVASRILARVPGMAENEKEIGVLEAIRNSSN